MRAAGAPLRIAYLSHQSTVGSETALVRMLSRLDRRRVEPIALLPGDGPLRAELEAAGVPVRTVSLRWWIPATDWSVAHFAAQLDGLGERTGALAAVLGEERVDLVHTNTIVTLEGALAAARLRLPHVWHSRGLFGDGFPPAYLDDAPFFLDGVGELADAVICVSRAVATQAAGLRGDPVVRVIYDGLDVDAWVARPPAARAVFLARHGIPPAARLAVCLGGLQRRKGQLDLVEALARLAPGHPALVVALAGSATDAPYVDELRARVAALGLGDRVKLLGFERDVRSLLASAEVLVHPSRSEGFGLAVVEAMALGVPVIATRCGGPEEAIEDGLSGLLVPPGDPAALAGALDRLLADAALRHTLARSGPDAARRFDLAATALRTLEIYDAVVASAARRTAEAWTARADAAARIEREIVTRAQAALSAGPSPAPPSRPRSGPLRRWLARRRGRDAGSRS